MTLTIGRAILDDPGDVRLAGQSIQMSGLFAVSEASEALNVAQYLAVREQLRGMVNNPDMDVWPLSWTEDATLDGYYRVLRAEVTPYPVALATGVAQWSVDLERPVGLVSPLCENITNSITMTNDHAVVADATIASVWAVPTEALSVVSPTSVAGLPAAGSRVTEDGALKLYRVDDVSSSGSWTVAPADFWESSARVEAQLAGSTFYPMVGRSFGATTTNWRLNNALVRITPTVVSGAIFGIEFYNGTSWSTVQDVRLNVRNPSTVTYTMNATIDTIVGVSVLRNSPEAVSLRITAKASAVTGSSADQVLRALNGHATIDLTLRRGEPLVRMSFGMNGLSGYTSVSAGPASGTQTTLTGGVRHDSTLNSGRVLVATANSFTSTVVGVASSLPSLANTAARSTNLFAIGYEIAGSSATTYNTAQQIIYQYLIALSERQRVVLR